MTYQMVDIEDLLPDTLIYARGCPEPAAMKHIRDAAREFCEKVRLWRDEDEFVVSTPESEGVCTISDAAIVEILRARLDDVELEPKTIGWLDENVRDWENYTEAGQARFITQLNPNTVSVVPRVSGTLKVRLTLMPSRTAMQVPDFLVADHGNAIGKGAAGRILMMPATDYTNPQLGAALINEFKAELATRAQKAAKGQQRGRQRARASFF